MQIKTVNLRQYLKALCGIASVLTLTGCNLANQHGMFNDPFAGNSSGTTTTPPAAPAAPEAPAVAGIGGTLPGVGALSVPTGNAVIQRIIIGVEGHASVSSGNFGSVSRQVIPNLSNSTDPTQFNGGDANMLLAYAACVDAGPGNFGITTSKTAAQNQAALIAAGIRFLNNYTAGLASAGAASAQLTAAVTNIVNQSIANGSTATMAFYTVCMAANTAGSTMMGF